MERIDLNKLKTFYYVAQEGSYQRASQHLGIKPSYISKHITSLEDHFKIKLFKRFRRSLVLTEKGQAFLKSVEILMHEVDKIEEMANVGDHGEDNTLRIVTTTGAMNLWVIRKLKDFVTLNPQYRLRIIATNESADILDPFIDVAILPKVDPHPEVIRKKLITVRTQLYASQEYLDKFGIPKTPADLDNHRLISFYHNEAGHRGNIDWHLSLGASPKRPRTPFLVINSAIGQYEAGIQGMGVVTITDGFPYTGASSLVKVLPNEGIDTIVYFATHINKRHHARVQSLMQFFSF